MGDLAVGKPNCVASSNQIKEIMVLGKVNAVQEPPCKIAKGDLDSAGTCDFFYPLVVQRNNSCQVLFVSGTIQTMTGSQKYKI